MLRQLEFYDIKDIVGLAGFDPLILNNLGHCEDSWRNEYTDKDDLVRQIEGYFLKFPDIQKAQFLNITIEEILSNKYRFGYQSQGLKNKLEYCLNRLGWQLIDNKVLPIEVLDLSDLKELDLAAREDLIKAATRFRDGDLQGAISATYAAVESVIARINKANDLGEIDYNKKSFQQRCKEALETTGVYSAITAQLTDIGWKEGDIISFNNNLKGSLNHAANVLQSLRNNMSDAHGKKPIIQPLAFDSIKWAQIIIRLLSEKYDD